MEIFVFNIFIGVKYLFFIIEKYLISSSNALYFMIPDTKFVTKPQIVSPLYCKATDVP